jgi:hypothetical protein
LVVDQVVGDDAGAPDPLVVTQEPVPTTIPPVEPVPIAFGGAKVIDLKTQLTVKASEIRQRADRDVASLVVFLGPLFAAAIASMLLRAIGDDTRITASIRLGGRTMAGCCGRACVRRSVRVCGAASGRTWLSAIGSV